MTLTDDQYDAIDAWLANHRLPAGIGTKDEACSIAAINLALYGELTDVVPECMSLVIGRWIIRIQDAMPDELRNSTDWKILLPSAAGTGRNREKERADLILDWMWGTVLPTVQPTADKHGFGAEWRNMCEKNTADAARLVKKVAVAVADAVAAAAAVADAAYAAAVADAAADAAAAAYAAAYAAADAAAATAAAAAADAATVAFWETVDPCSLLAKLIAVGY